MSEEMTKTITIKPNNDSSSPEISIEQTIALPPQPTGTKSIPEILGVKIDTGLSWYWEGSIIILALALIYVGKKAIDNRLFRRRKSVK
jgi:hypothetical protein